MKLFVQTLGFCVGKLVGRHGEAEMHRGLRVILTELCNQAAGVGILLGKLLEGPLLVVLGPPPNRQLCDLDTTAASHIDHTSILILADITRNWCQRPLKASVPWMHGLKRFSTQVMTNVLDDLTRIVVGNAGCPAYANAFRTVHQSHGNDGAVPFGLYAQALFAEVLKHSIVCLWKDAPCHGRQAREDVTRSCVILSPLNPRTELATRNKQVDVVGAYEVLRHSYDGALQRSFAMMISSVLCHVTRKLGDLHVASQLFAEASVQYLPLPRLEAIHNAGDHPQDIILRP
mmetsp:Transcript_46338/g.81494  ORF Transcript_46338/g.81494 Transcript_46338/m.81494 type:complete len:288 (-) Transcript_46338:1346-2209(-)